MRNFISKLKIKFMKKYAFLFFAGFLVVSCKTQSKFEDKNIVLMMF